jgi:hypothetical protein
LRMGAYGGQEQKDDNGECCVFHGIDFRAKVSPQSILP